MTDLARLVVKMEAENAQLLKKLDQTNNRLQKWERKTSKSVDKVKTAFVALAGAVAAVGFVRMAQEALSAADKIAKGDCKLAMIE